MARRFRLLLLLPALCVVLILAAQACGEGKPTTPSDKQVAPAEGPSNFTQEGELDLVDSTGVIVKTIVIEIADTEYDRERGLMHRPYLPESAGMLFIFGREEYRSFWMKNTILSLDILFIGQDGVINTIHKYTTPYSESSIPSRAPSTYVLEVNAGFCDNHGIAEGMNVVFRRNLKEGV